MSIRINVDPANPGQFFACCGLLELADRFWGGAAGAFSSPGIEFSLYGNRNSGEVDAKELLAKLSRCAITSTMTEQQIARLKRLLNQKKTSLTAPELAEKEWLSGLWEQERLRLHDPFDFWVDWWGDQYAGGNRFKTWAGKQFVIDLVRGMQASMRSDEWSSLPPANWLHEPASDGSLPLYFDANIGSQSSSLDAGFSMDALEIRSCTRPMIEFAAFVGLQRFRPTPLKHGAFSYALWTEPLPPTLAAVACCGQLLQLRARSFEFRLLYRTKYLKSFLSAKSKEAD